MGAQVSDNDVDDPPDTMTGNAVWSFTTVGPPARIHDIQGAAHRSPLEGHAVSSVPGIVTAKVSNGFFFEDPNPDSNSRLPRACSSSGRRRPTQSRSATPSRSQGS